MSAPGSCRPDQTDTPRPSPVPLPQTEGHPDCVLRDGRTADARRSSEGSWLIGGGHLAGLPQHQARSHPIPASHCRPQGPEACLRSCVHYPGTGSCLNKMAQYVYNMQQGLPCSQAVPRLRGVCSFFSPPAFSFVTRVSVLTLVFPFPCEHYLSCSFTRLYPDRALPMPHHVLHISKWPSRVRKLNSFRGFWDIYGSFKVTECSF